VGGDENNDGDEGLNLIDKEKTDQDFKEGEEDIKEIYDNYQKIISLLDEKNRKEMKNPEEEEEEGEGGKEEESTSSSRKVCDHLFVFLLCSPFMFFS
jgi:hypothetical protein